MLEGAKAAGWRGSRRGKSGRCLSEKNFDTASRSRVSLHGGTRAFLSRIRRCPSACSAHSVEGTGISLPEKSCHRSITYRSMLSIADAADPWRCVYHPPVLRQVGIAPSAAAGGEGEGDGSVAVGRALLA